MYIVLFSGFRGTHRPPAPPSHGIGDNAPDANDEADFVMWGWSENTSCQGPEHAHIDIIKSVAHLTNNKDVFLCILR